MKDTYMRHFKVLVILFLSNLSLMAQQESDSILGADSIEKQVVILNQNRIYKERIKSVRIGAKSSKYSEPIISIRPGSKIELVFDDLNDDYQEYHYRLVHCDRYWMPAEEIYEEFYDGFSSRIIEEYEFSSATKIDFTRYQLVLPKDGEKFLRSGNYLLHVFEAETNSMILTRRFMVVNPTITINGEVTKTDDVRYMDYRQQVKFEVYDPKSVLQDISKIYTKISKNASWDIYCDDIKPSFVNNDKITFERVDACTFEGGNEYRFFNMIEFRNISNNIVKVEIKPTGLYHFWLDDDRSRSYLNYSTIEDYNGKTLYTSKLKSFNPIEQDYAMVHFNLKLDEVLHGYEIYLYGELSDFKLDESFKMNYNGEKDRYELSKLLKQGLYNYQYITTSIYQEGPDESMIEGSHFETENDYTIFLYYSNTYEGFDQLLGIERINSRNKVNLLYKNK